MTLRATDLVCRRGGRALFAPASFVLAPGQALMLRGPNGIGKTTLLRGLAGLAARPEGEALFRERPLWTAEGTIAYSGHLDAVKPGLSVSENLAFWARLLGGDAAAAMARFDLEPLADRTAGRLSAGQKRRLGLARLPLTAARLWLLDEPTVSLDAQTVERLTCVIRTHLADGGMAILATHVDIPLGASAQTLALRPAAADAVVEDPFLEGFDT